MISTDIMKHWIRFTHRGNPVLPPANANFSCWVNDLNSFTQEQTDLWGCIVYFVSWNPGALPMVDGRTTECHKKLRQNVRLRPDSVLTSTAWVNVTSLKYINARRRAGVPFFTSLNLNRHCSECSGYLHWNISKVAAFLVRIMDNSKQRPSDKRKREASPSSSATSANDSIKKTETAPASMQVCTYKNAHPLGRDLRADNTLISLLKANGVRLHLSPSTASFKIWCRLVKKTRKFPHRLHGWSVYIETFGRLMPQRAQIAKMSWMKIDDSSSQTSNCVRKKSRWSAASTRYSREWPTFSRAWGNIQLEVPRSFRKLKKLREYVVGFLLSPNWLSVLSCVEI